MENHTESACAREEFHLLVHAPNARKSQAWTKSGAILVFHMDGRGTHVWFIFC